MYVGGTAFVGADAATQRVTVGLTVSLPCSAQDPGHAQVPSSIHCIYACSWTFAICYRPSVCHLSSVTLVRPTQAVQIFGNISTALGTLAIH